MTQVSTYTQTNQLPFFVTFNGWIIIVFKSFLLFMNQPKQYFHYIRNEYISLPYAVLYSNFANSSSCLIGQCRRLFKILIQCFNQILIEFIYNFILQQARMNNVMVCHVHKDKVEKLDSAKMVKIFVERESTRSNTFGNFAEI